jgi:hypothetical protein
MGDTIGTQDALLSGLATPQSIQVIPGDRGPGLVYRGETVHDAGSPMEEAAAWVSQAVGRLSSKSPPRLALVMGLGLGWHIRRLKELFPAIDVAVYEPDRDIVDTYEKYNVLSQGQDPRIYHDFERFEAVVAQEVVHGDGSFPVVLVVPGYERAFPAEAGRF